MTSNKRFSKNHKQLIKQIEQLLGASRPFFVDMTSGNHLSFLIEGVDKPLFTSGTPSDRKAYTNFIAEVKRAITPMEAAELTEEEQQEQQLICTNKMMEQCIANCGRLFRQRKAVLAEQEQQRFDEHGDVDLLAQQRADLVKEQIGHDLKQRHQTSYIKPKMMRVLNKQVRHHLDFLLPSLAAYHSEQKQAQQELVVNESQTEMAKQTAVDAVSERAPLALVANGGHSVVAPSEVKPVLELKASELTAEKVVKAPSTSKAPGPKTVTGKALQSQQLQQLASLSSNNRINLFRQLTKATMAQMIDDLQVAMARNEAQAIEEILAKVTELDLPREQLIARLQNG